MDFETSNLKQGCAEEGRVAGMLRGFMLAILALAMTGTFLDLLLFDHYQDAWQMIPLGLLGLAATTLVWSAIRPSAMSVRALRVAMVLLVCGSVAGVILHSQASAGFHGELEGAGKWQMMWAVLHSKVPPTLAPAALLQMGLIGLASTYRHPAIRRRDSR